MVAINPLYLAWDSIAPRPSSLASVSMMNCHSSQDMPGWRFRWVSPRTDKPLYVSASVRARWFNPICLDAKLQSSMWFSLFSNSSRQFRRTGRQIAAGRIHWSQWEPGGPAYEQTLFLNDCDLCKILSPGKLKKTYHALFSALLLLDVYTIWFYCGI